MLDACGGEDPFYPTQVFSNNGNGHQRQFSIGASISEVNSGGERRYPQAVEGQAWGSDQQQMMISADEKVNELSNLLEQQQHENDQLRDQL